MDNYKVAVIGHGLMGRGIIHSYASHGFKVIAIKRRKHDERLKEYFQREVEKKRLAKEKYHEILANIHVSTDITEVADCQLVIECISEDQEKKQLLFSKLDSICQSETILASNTSSIAIGKFTKVTNRPDKIVGLHYMSPVPLMELVEIIKTPETSEETLKTVVEITERIRKVPIVINDFPGFISSRLVVSLINEAANILMQGVTDVVSIDMIAKLGLNLPMGPLQLADEIGLDIVSNVMNSMYQSFEDSKYITCPLIKEMVEADHLGKKNGKGFYSYR